MNRHVVPKGRIRQIIRATRRERVLRTADNPNTRAQARLEVDATIPVFDTDAGRAELAGYMRANR